MGRASTERANMQQKMVAAVEKLSTEDLKAMLLASLNLAGTYEMNLMAEATSSNSFEQLCFDLDLVL